MNGYMESLVGHTVIGIDVSRGEEALRFRCADGSAVVWVTEGDCCSTSWWADGFSLGQLRGATVRAVESIDLPTPDDDRTRQEYDVAYGVKLTTDRGAAQFAYRNSSNGYYGGWAGLGRDAGYEWREIAEGDWRA